MKIAVIGAGFIGLTSAYFLKKRGYDVCVVDRQPESGRESSFMNGAQLSYCHAEPWASKASLINAAKWIGKSNAPLLFRLYPDLNLIKWLVQFVDNTREDKFIQNNKTILHLNLYSRYILHQIENEFDFNWNYEKNGKIFIYRSQKSYQKGLDHARFQETIGSKYEILNHKDILDREPALENLIENISGAIFDPLDESADGYKFCQGMQKKLEAMGVEFHLNTNVEKLIKSENKIAAIKTTNDEIKADLFVLAAGASSPFIAKTVGIKLPIYPLKGYSIGVDIINQKSAPKISITDSSERVVYSKVGNTLRVSGTAEIAGYNYKITRNRIDLLRASCDKNFPNIGDVKNSARWACLRPMTPDGPPIIDKTKYSNLFLNTGHGSLGWTQNFASAQILSDLIEGKTPEIDTSQLTLQRYSLKEWIKSLN